MPFLSQALTRAAYFLYVFPKQDDQMQTAYQCREGIHQKITNGDMDRHTEPTSRERDLSRKPWVLLTEDSQGDMDRGRVAS